MKSIWKYTSFILSVVFACWQHPSYSQKNEIDSLENSIKHAPGDTLTVAALYNLALQYSFFPEKAGVEKKYTDQLCLLAETLNYPLGKAYCWDLQGIQARNTSHYGQALAFHKRALKIAENLGNLQAQALFYNHTGVVYRRFDDYQNALHYHLAALKVAEKIHDKRNISTAVNSIGNIYYSMKAYGKSLNYFAKGLELEKELHNSIGIAINLNNTGGVYEKLGDLTKALFYYKESLLINQAMENTKGIAICYNDMGNLYRKMGSPKDALVYFQRSLQLNEAAGDKKYISDNYINLGLASADMKDFGLAIYYLKKGLHMALQIQTKEEIQYGYESLSEIYARAGEYKTALDYHHKATAYKDSLLNEHNQKNIARLQTIFDTQQKEVRINLLEDAKLHQDTQLRQQRMYVAILVISLIFILLLFGIVYRNNRNRKALNRILKYQNAAMLHQKDILDLKNQELVRLNDEKTYLMGVVAHDLRSPLSRISGLANLLKLEPEGLSTVHKEYIRLIGKTAGQLNDMIARILDITAIESQKINLDLEPVNMTTLLQEIVSNFQASADKKNIRLHYTCISAEHMAKSDWGYATQVFENLISNAIKFSPAGKQIFITLREEKDKIVAQIKDQGPGFSKEDMPKLFGKFQRLSAQSTAGEKSTGLGLSIVKKYVEAMQGEISCYSEPGQGATFTVCFQKALIAQSAAMHG